MNVSHNPACCLTDSKGNLETCCADKLGSALLFPAQHLDQKPFDVKAGQGVAIIENRAAWRERGGEKKYEVTDECAGGVEVDTWASGRLELYIAAHYISSFPPLPSL